jgi:hypothetical protein
VADLLANVPLAGMLGNFGAAEEADWTDGVEATDFGLARRLRSPITIASMPLAWDRPAVKLGSVPPTW